MADVQVEAYHRFHTDGEPFPDYLPYHAVEDGVVLLCDRKGQTSSFGMIWEVEPARLEGAPEDNWDIVAAAVNGMLLRLPEDAACQLLLMSDPQVADDLSGFLGLTCTNGLARSVCEDRVRLYQESTDGLFEHNGLPFRCRRVRVYCTVRLWPAPPQGGRLWWRRGAETAIDRWLTAVRSSMEKVDEMLVDSLRFSGVQLRRLGADAVKRLLWRCVNPTLPTTPDPYRDDCLLREQVCGFHPTVDGAGTADETHQKKVVVLTAAEPPPETWAGMCIRELEFGRTRASLVDVLPQLCLVWNIHVLPQQQALDRVKRHKAIAWLQNLDPLRGFSEEHRVIREDLEKVITQVFDRGDRILATGVHALVVAPEEEREQQVYQVQAAMGRLGFRMITEDAIGASLWMQCLPLGFDPLAESVLRRARRYVSTNTADMLPFQGHFRGVGEPYFLYLSRHGEPVAFDPFAAANAPHLFIAGSTGMGKSVYVIDAILQALRTGAHVFVIDKGDSYGRLCRMMRGQHVIVEPEAPIRINPLAGPLTKEKQGTVWLLLVEMMQGRAERDLLTREHEGMVERATVTAYRHKRQREVFLSDVAAVLEDEGHEGRALARRLEPFLRSGRYGRYFDGPNELTLDNPLTIFELAQLDRDPDLQRIMVLVLINAVTQFVSVPSQLAQRKFLWVDEGWTLFQSESAARYIGEAARTYRKYGTCLGPVTQQPRDALQSRGGQAVRDNTQIRVLFQQPPDVAEAVVEELSLTPAQRTLFRSLESVPGKFAEALLLTPNGSGVIRIVLPPSVYWIATTKPNEREYIDRLAQTLGSLEAAIPHAAKAYPHGL